MRYEIERVFECEKMTRAHPGHISEHMLVWLWVVQVIKWTP